MYEGKYAKFPFRRIKSCCCKSSDLPFKYKKLSSFSQQCPRVSNMLTEGSELCKKARPQITSTDLTSRAFTLKLSK